MNAILNIQVNVIWTYKWTFFEHPSERSLNIQVNVIWTSKCLSEMSSSLWWGGGVGGHLATPDYDGWGDLLVYWYNKHQTTLRHCWRPPLYDHKFTYLSKWCVKLRSGSVFHGNVLALRSAIGSSCSIHTVHFRLPPQYTQCISGVASTCGGRSRGSQFPRIR